MQENSYHSDVEYFPISINHPDDIHGRLAHRELRSVEGLDLQVLDGERQSGQLIRHFHADPVHPTDNPKLLLLFVSPQHSKVVFIT